MQYKWSQNYCESKRVLPSSGQRKYKNVPRVRYMLVKIHKDKLELPEKEFHIRVPSVNYLPILQQPAQELTS